MCWGLPGLLHLPGHSDRLHLVGPENPEDRMDLPGQLVRWARTDPSGREPRIGRLALPVPPDLPDLVHPVCRAGLVDPACRLAQFDPAVLPAQLAPAHLGNRAGRLARPGQWVLLIREVRLARLGL